MEVRIILTSVRYFLNNMLEKENNLRKTTLLFLIKEEEKKIKEICLAMKKRGFGKGRWNGVGGKVEEGKETIEEAVLREAKEEIDIFAQDIKKVAEISFYFPHNPEFNQEVHIYFSTNWEGEIKESEEMLPKWFSAQDIPYDTMWSDDPFWLPKVLEGKILRAIFKFKENDIVDYKEINFINKF